MNANQTKDICVICEGPTERKFVRDILSKYFEPQNFRLYGTMCGDHDGDVKFDRYSKDIYKHLKNNPIIYVTTFVDFEGMNQKWPGYESACRQTDAQSKAFLLCEETKKALQIRFPEQDWDRFIPYVSMFEFEGLLFSDPKIIADVLKSTFERFKKFVINMDRRKKSIIHRQRSRRHVWKD